MRGSVLVEYTLARLGAEKMWRLVHQEKPLCALGALTGNQAIQEIQAGLKAIYCSGWQVAGDGNSSGQMYPDQSLYPVDSVPKMVERINNAFTRTDEIYALILCRSKTSLQRCTVMPYTEAWSSVQFATRDCVA